MHVSDKEILTSRAKEAFYAVTPDVRAGAVMRAPCPGPRRIVEYMTYDPQKTRDVFKFFFVRNPWDRLLSACSYLKQGEGAS
jgi:hypothetical protein